VVVSVNVWLIELCPVDWAEPPVNPVPVGAVHVYIVPEGTPVGVTIKAVPLQVVIVWLLTDGVRVIVNVFVDVAAEHAPLPFAVNVNVTLPAVMSAVLGV